MRILLFNLSLLLSLSTNAGHGIVTTLEAPIIGKLDVDAPTIMTVRKGKKIYIHDKHFKNGPNEVLYTRDDEQDDFGAAQTVDGYEKFYETIDRNGQTAYISKYYVKLITHDEREFTQNVTPFNPDPNDYRLAEPLPENYPFDSPNMGRARVSFSFGPDLKSTYQYNSVLTEESFSNRYGFEISFGRKANWDNENRFYFGGLVQIWTSEAKFKLFDDRTTTESRSQVSLGPYLSYDPWRNNNLKLTVQTSLLVSFTRNLVGQVDTSGFQEERMFKSLALTPRFSSFLQWTTATQSLRVLTGFDVQFYLPHELTSSTPATTNFWNTEDSGADSVNIPFSAHWALFIGIQSDY